MLNSSEDRVNDKIKTSELYTMSMVYSHRFGRVLARVIIGLSLLFFVVIFLPWKQNIFTTDGSTISLTPEDRPQTVATAIAGKIEHWKVREGQYVKKGDTIVVLTEVKEKYFDPELMTRLAEQKNAKKEAVNSTQEKINQLQNQINAIKNAKNLAYNKSKNKFSQARLKVIIDSADLQAEKSNFQIASDQFDRSQQLITKGLISQSEFEKRKQKLQEVTAKLISFENKLSVSRTEYINTGIDINSIQADYTDKLSKAEGELASTEAYLHNSEGDYAKIQNEYNSTEIRNGLYVVKAPQNGIIMKAIRSGIGEIVKDGEAICTIMPENPQIAAEMYVYPMDIPLLSKGRTVRLEFDGWPALQVSGWPRVSLGTFAGKIEVIDFVESTNDKFRILVVPDPKSDPWPHQLRIGSGVKGWCLLEDVPIWYEIWRQLNGFRPSLKAEPKKEDYSKPKQKE